MTGATVLLVVACIVVLSLVARSVWAGGPGATLVTARGCALPAGSVLVGGRAAESAAAALGFRFGGWDLMIYRSLPVP